MKIRTVKYIIKDGITNISKNKLMSLAAISIVVASLTIFGIFYMLITNFEFNVMNLREQPEIQVFCQVDLDDIGVKIIENRLTSNTDIKSVNKISKDQAFEKVKSLLGDDINLLEGMDNSFLPISFIIKLNNPEDGESLIKELESISGVDKVSYPQKSIEFISKFSGWIQIVSSFLIIVLLIVSVFIISNTIKLTVFARRGEISIMKYIGATNWFIRWPFIIEGVIIGILGATFAFLISGYGYRALEIKFAEEITRTGTTIVKLLDLKSICIKIITFYFVLGSAVGAVGSTASIRKYLNV
jgi:cell division transport system permease protein